MPSDLLTILGLILWGIGIYLYLMPVPCGHDCAQCRAERVRQRERSADDEWSWRHRVYDHESHPVDACPHCRRK